ncbi:MAG TPA: metallophosphoesterase [Alphaproteobacteria bacterium]|nr:metallophosphoesterase [Alphaproteobacteria bacterium]
MFWKRSRSGGETVVIFFASDLHGSNVCFRKFVNAVQFYGANVLVMGGDMTGKAVLPITEQPDRTFLAFQAGSTIKMTNSEEVDAFIKRAGDMGFYPVLLSENEYRRLRDDEHMRHELFKKLVIERVREWCRFAEQKLTGKEVPFITSPGNDDFVEIDEVLRTSPAVQFHEMEVTELRGYQLLHCGGSNHTPWNTEREYSEEEYETRFAKLLPLVSDMQRCIFNVHVPPYGTVLDQCPKLDERLQVVFEMGNPVQMHAGSTTLLEIIRTHQPLLGLHGHIHEGRGQIKIGNTVCVNPGSVYPEGMLQGVLVTLQDGTVKSVHLTQG